MTRKLPECPQPPFAAAKKETAKHTFMTLTPTYGGGIEPGVPDLDRPVRASAVRGHLRFWWRATRGARLASVKELRDEEGRIWGTTETPSPVTVTVRVLKPPVKRPLGDPNAPFGFNKWGAEMYALFPAREEREDPSRDRPARRPEEAVLLKEGLEFEVAVEWPSEMPLRRDIEAALVAWANFGGIGARTRRGLGALWCKDLAFERMADVKEWLKATRDGTPTKPRPWPVLSANLTLHRNLPGKGALDAWRDPLELLRAFRQAPGTGRNPGAMKNRPGRSRWPEPETIRTTLRQRDPKHQELRDHPSGFPRAAFGLPMVFHFQSRTDPGDSVLYPRVEGAKAERMASPLVLRPVRLKGGGHVALIARLQAPPPEGLLLEWSRGNSREIPATSILNPAFGSYRDSPLAGADGALEAFHSFASDPKNGGYDTP